MQNNRDLTQIWSTSNFQCQICRLVCSSRIALFSYSKSYLQEFILMLLNLKSERELWSIKYKGNRLWNNLSAEIKNIQSTGSFKYKLENYLLQSLV